ncbi:unnamed protein product [Allacma fusca]|uniref:Uncharacterized protein n=1 Tax=Allacma fusca TaxID=39272 RepID=A0A8J2NXY5_9HEXA|nr:unnamed protein product [Allacma fusca]
MFYGLVTPLHCTGRRDREMQRRKSQDMTQNYFHLSECPDPCCDGDYDLTMEADSEHKQLLSLMGSGGKKLVGMIKAEMLFGDDEVLMGNPVCE